MSSAVPKNSAIVRGADGKWTFFQNLDSPSHRSPLDVVLDPQPDWWRGGPELDGEEPQVTIEGWVVGMDPAEPGGDKTFYGSSNLWGSQIHSKNPCAEIALGMPELCALQPKIWNIDPPGPSVLDQILSD